MSEPLMAVINVLASQTTSKEERLAACDRVCTLSSKCSESQLQRFMRAGGTSAITALLKSEDEDLVDAAAAALTNLSAPAVRRPELRTFEFKGTRVCVHELPYAESGTAHNVWTAALVLAQYLARSSDFAACVGRGDRVLELGSGLGVCGILAGKLGARVTLSDFVPKVLENLSQSISTNNISSHARAVSLNWADEASIRGQCSNHGWYAGADGEQCQHPSLDENEQFDVVLGSDICYENDHPALLEAVLRRRLCPGGRVWLLNAVRFPKLHEELLERLRSFCSEVSSEAVDSAEGVLSVDIIEEGSTQHSSKYAGGMQLVLARR